MSDSSVKVGVRIRPLLGNDDGERIPMLENLNMNQLCVNNKTFTFDYLFPEDIKQSSKYICVPSILHESSLNRLICVNCFSHAQQFLGWI